VDLRSLVLIPLVVGGAWRRRVETRSTVEG
jgi:hypothetical protein